MIWEKLKFTRNKRKILHEKKEWYLRKLHFSLEGVWKIHTLSHWVKFIYTVCATVKLVRLYIRSWKNPSFYDLFDPYWQDLDLYTQEIYILYTGTLHVMGGGGGLQCCWTHRKLEMGRFKQIQETNNLIHWFSFQGNVGLEL